MTVGLIALAMAVASNSAPAAPVPSYSLLKTVPLGTPDRWDYVVYDDQIERVFVAHGDRLDVIDATSGKLVGQVTGITGGTHGSAVSLATGQGFTDDGRSGKAVAFDLHTLKVTHEIPADVDADALAVDRATGHLFVVEGDPAAVTVIDPKNDAPIATIKAGEKLEYAAADGHGAVFLAGEAKGDLVKIDARTNSVAAHWPAPGCMSPHGLAVDGRSHRAFLGCANNVMAVMDTRSGRVVANLPIGSGNDTVAFDPVRKKVFSSNGRDGTISVYQQHSADDYTALAPIQTILSARTMALNPKNGWLFVAGADTDAGPGAGARRRVRPGTLRLLIFAPRP